MEKQTDQLADAPSFCADFSLRGLYPILIQSAVCHSGTGAGCGELLHPFLLSKRNDRNRLGAVRSSQIRYLSPPLKAAQSRRKF